MKSKRKPRKPLPMVEPSCAVYDGLGLVITWPLKVESIANGSWGHWSSGAARMKRMRASVEMCLRMYHAHLPKPPFGCRLIRIGPRVLDSDNLPYAMKAARDQVADHFGMKDDDKLGWVWMYGQDTRQAYGIGLTIWPLPAPGVRPPLAGFAKGMFEVRDDFNEPLELAPGVRQSPADAKEER